MLEVWRFVDGFPNYMISDRGRVKSIGRVVNGGKWNTPRRLPGRLLKPAKAHNGYHFVCLFKNGKKYNKRIHQLVAHNFIGLRPDGLVIHHKDGNKTNNTLDNLEYTTRQRNAQEYYKSIGKACGVIPLTDVPKIIKRVGNGEECCKIASEYNVSRNDIAVLCKIILLTGEELTINLK